MSVIFTVAELITLTTALTKDSWSLELELKIEPLIPIKFCINNILKGSEVVGDIVGNQFRVGITEGSGVGFKEAAIKGNLVGWIEGTIVVGFTVGRRVDGLNVGTLVGFSLGYSVGISEGTILGLSVGSSDGPFVVSDWKYLDEERYPDWGSIFNEYTLNTTRIINM